MLIIMEHGNVHPFPERLFDDEAFGRLDIFKVDSAKARLHQRNRVDESIRILGVQFEVDRIDVGEAFEKDGLAFHHRLRCKRAQIARSEEHTSELKSLMRISYAVFCLKKKKTSNTSQVDTNP